MPVTAGFLVPHPPLIIPSVGKGQEGEIAKTVQSYHEVARQIAALKPDTIIVFSPHSTLYSDYIHVSPGESASGGFSAFGSSEEIHATCDSGLAAELEALCRDSGLPAGTLGEAEKEIDHGTLIPLYFINQYYTDYKLLRVAPSGLPREEHYLFGMLLRAVVQKSGRNAVVIASGDLSHRLREDGPYGYLPEGPELDRALTTVMSSGRFDRLFDLDPTLCQKGGECGLLPFLMLAGALDGQALNCKLHSYEGPFGVGYAVASFLPKEADATRRFLALREEQRGWHIYQLRQQEDAWVRLARITVEEYVRTGEIPPLPDNLPTEMTGKQAGVFVTIKKRGQLRGCIGTIEPVRGSVAEEIRQNAASAAAHDPRFQPIQESELSSLVYSVDVMGEPEPTDLSGLDPFRYGVIVVSGSQRGLLLPHLEGIDTVEQQVAIAREKAGIAPDIPCAYERFEVVRHQ